jgi:N-acetylmuramoyl-L-alanine amidase
VYCSRTREALNAFQRKRGLAETSVCDEETWQILTESTWALGSRLLYLTSPHLRGDDVEQLQVRLARLGFNCGKADGIFGALTAQGLADFQQNYGLLPDGICGAETLRALERIGSQSGDGPGVVAVREAEGSRGVATLRVAVGAFDIMAPVAERLTRRLRTQGSLVVLIESDDPLRHVAAANSFAADLYVGITQATTSERIAFYETDGFVSPTGARLAASIASRLGGQASALGARHPVLRETRMPAVLCSMDLSPSPPEAMHRAIVVAEAIAEWEATSSESG